MGGYVRLSDAGLGCPDWPGCYGELLGVPDTEGERVIAQKDYPDSPVSESKAWKEMAHRYLAGLLGLALLALAVIGWRVSRITIALCVLVVIQALLGMWTVTLLLKPAVVVLHLTGGMSIIALLAWLATPPQKSETQSGKSSTLFSRSHKPPLFLFVWGWAALSVVFLQIALGGWVSANYAALACPDFPVCRGQWWPDNMNFTDALSLWGEVGVNYEFGRLNDAARMTIHVIHRLGAAILIAIAGGFFLAVILRAQGTLRTIGAMSLFVLFVQAGLGVANVLYSLPLTVATAHNAGAALLLIGTTSIVARMTYARHTRAYKQ